MGTLIGLRDVSVAFPGTLALDGVSLDVEAGDVLAVVGANGSGKTTLLSTLCGLRAPSAGQLVDGDGPVRFTRPADALAHGIAMVPQEPQLAETLPVWENLVVGTRGLLRPAAGRAARADARRIVAASLPHVDPDQPAGALRKADRAVLALLRALVREPRVLALDEPTAVLGESSVQVVASATEQVRAGGGAVVLVSHRLRDIVELATRVAVLVDGRLVHDSPIVEVSVEDLVDRLAAGRSTAAAPASAAARPPLARSGATLAVDGLRSASGLEIDRLRVEPGEIVGLAGLAGSGRSRLCRTVTGCERGGGAIRVDGAPLPGSPAACRRAGIAYVPEDRAREGVFPSLTVERNLEVGDLVHRGLLRAMPWRPSRERIGGLISQFGVKTASPRAPIESLSGGNQQRVVLARVLANRPRVLVADEPTQGVDRAGRAAIHAMIRGFAEGGGAVLLVSSEFEELQALATRLCVMRDGRIVAEVPPDADYRRLVALATGTHEELHLEAGVSVDGA